MLVKTLNPKAKIYVEVLHDENAEVFEKRLGVTSVFIYGKVIGRLIFTSIATPGSAKLVENLLTKEGALRKVMVKEIGNFSTFGELLAYLRKYDLLPIAVEKEGRMIISPPDGEELSERDYVFFISGRV